jgi:RPA family protein
MSADDGGPGRREVAHRLFAAEFDDATVSYAESDEERAPKYVVTPTGARVNRLFAVGVLTEVEDVNEDVLRARVVDYTGAFVSYAGQYQPDAAAFFERHRTEHAFVALTGKARTFEPNDGDRIYSSVRPESVAAVDADTRDRWTVSAAEATLRRVAATAEAKSLDVAGDDLRAALEDRGYDEALAAGVAVALDRYGTTTAYLEAVRRLAVDALEVVAGERTTDEIRGIDVSPDDAGTTSLGPLPASGAGDPPEPAAAGGTADDGAADAEPAVAGGTTATEPAATDDPGVASTPTESGTGDASDAGETGAATGGDAVGTDAPTTDVGDAPTADPDPGTDDEPTPAADPGDETPAEEGLGDFQEDDLYELDEEERREVEESFDVGFESGTEVDDPGEAGIDVPDPEAVAEADAEAGMETETETETDPVDADPAAAATGNDDGATVPDDGGGGDAGAETGTEGEGAAPDVDLETAAVEAIASLDDGDGADREAVVAAVVDDHGADPGAVADAIEDALLSGKCYEPSEDRLKAI